MGISSHNRNPSLPKRLRRFRGSSDVLNGSKSVQCHHRVKCLGCEKPKRENSRCQDVFSCAFQKMGCVKDCASTDMSKWGVAYLRQQNGENEGLANFLWKKRLCNTTHKHNLLLWIDRLFSRFIKRTLAQSIVTCIARWETVKRPRT